MRLTRTEQRIFDAMESKPFKEWTIDELGDIAYREIDKRPINWRVSIGVIMRTLTTKTTSRLQRIRRISSVGRGHKALYTLDTSRKASFLFREKERR